MGRHRAARPPHARRLLLLLTGAALAASLLPVSSASAKTYSHYGYLDNAAQGTNGRVSLRGWAYDPRHSSVSTKVEVYVDGHLISRSTASASRPDVDRIRHVTGRHGFALCVAAHRHAHVVSVYADPIGSGRAHWLIGTADLNGYRSWAGPRIVATAKKYVGHPYRAGGASPSGFDCSGYTMYVYKQAGVATLARNAETQRRHMHLIPGSQAKPGDLVFYMSGGRAYHVAIYAGGGPRIWQGRQYAATTPGEGVKYQHIWSSAIQFGTDWH